MSREILCQICQKKKFSNREITGFIVYLLQKQRINIKQVSDDLDISVHRAHNWYYRDTGMTAADLVKIMRKYEFVREAVEVLSRMRFVT